MRFAANLLTTLLIFSCLIVAASSAHQLLQWQSGDSELPTTNTEFRVFDGQRHHSIHLDDEGRLHGQIMLHTFNQSTTIDVFQNRKRIARTTATQAGQFVLKQLEPGLVSIRVDSSNGYALFGAEVLKHDPEIESQTMQLVLADRGRTVARQFVQQQSQFEPYQSPTNTSLIHGGNRVLLVDHQLTGVIWSANKKRANHVTLMLLKNGKPVASTTTDERGTFIVRDLEPGQYDVVARGRPGIAVVHVQLIESPTVETELNVMLDRIKADPQLEIMLARLPQNEIDKQLEDSSNEPSNTQQPTIEAQPFQIVEFGMSSTVSTFPGSGLIGPGEIGLVVSIIALLDDDPPVIPPRPQSPNQ